MKLIDVIGLYKLKDQGFSYQLSDVEVDDLACCLEIHIDNINEKDGQTRCIKYLANNIEVAYLNSPVFEGNTHIDYCHIKLRDFIEANKKIINEFMIKNYEEDYSAYKKYLDDPEHDPYWEFYADKFFTPLINEQFPLEELEELADMFEDPRNHYKTNDYEDLHTDFFNDPDKMKDFYEISKEEFLKSHSLNSTNEIKYENTKKIWELEKNKEYIYQFPIQFVDSLGMFDDFGLDPVGVLLWDEHNDNNYSYELIVKGKLENLYEFAKATNEEGTRNGYILHSNYLCRENEFGLYDDVKPLDYYKSLDEALGYDWVDLELEDDSSLSGGKSYEDEKLPNFIFETFDSNEKITFKKVNEALKDCGIKTLKPDINWINEQLTNGLSITDPDLRKLVGFKSKGGR